MFNGLRVHVVSIRVGTAIDDIRLHYLHCMHGTTILILLSTDDFFSSVDN